MHWHDFTCQRPSANFSKAKHEDRYHFHPFPELKLVVLRAPSSFNPPRLCFTASGRCAASVVLGRRFVLSDASEPQTLYVVPQSGGADRVQRSRSRARCDGWRKPFGQQCLKHLSQSTCLQRFAVLFSCVKKCQIAAGEGNKNTHVCCTAETKPFPRRTLLAGLLAPAQTLGVLLLGSKRIQRYQGRLLHGYWMILTTREISIIGWL